MFSGARVAVGSNSNSRLFESQGACICPLPPSIILTCPCHPESQASSWGSVLFPKSWLALPKADKEQFAISKPFSFSANPDFEAFCSLKSWDGILSLPKSSPSYPTSKPSLRQRMPLAKEGRGQQGKPERKGAEWLKFLCYWAQTRLPEWRAAPLNTQESSAGRFIPVSPRGWEFWQFAHLGNNFLQN